MEIMSLGDNLRVLRKKKGWTQQELATKTGIKLAHISTLEGQESDPKLSTLYKLIDALECTPNELLTSEGKTGKESVFRSCMESAEALPNQDKAMLVRIVRKFMAADYMRLAQLATTPDELLEDIARDQHLNDLEENESPDFNEVKRDVEQAREIKRGGYR